MKVETEMLVEKMGRQIVVHGVAVESRQDPSVLSGPRVCPTELIRRSHHPLPDLQPTLFPTTSPSTQGVCLLILRGRHVPKHRQEL
ncbi:hypothetical protein FQN60_009281 [Etheostoma spectabile]|uniref:Uncharacterized protein n=1 Tax=Etheostoma spectabile TaxID=54343 RepID=A0A5J5DIH7_9PERO|nr:hypothetical protein FQN60_009281 [Etheostoma spectabile]